jgi:hypothetical protein
MQKARVARVMQASGHGILLDAIRAKSRDYWTLPEKVLYNLLNETGLTKD